MKPIDSFNALVAYIDILGYAAILKEKQPVEYYEAINNALSQWNNFFTDDVKNKYVVAKKFSENIFLEVFSDTFVIALDESKITNDPEIHLSSAELFNIFCFVVSYLMKDIFFKTKHLLRGAIARGKFYAKEFDALKGNNFVFSEALAEAYKFAEEIADTPRVIICNSIFNQFKPINLISHNHPRAALIQDNDGLCYLNVYSPITVHNTTIDGPFIEAKQLIEESLELNFKDTIRLRKWVWFANYHNHIIDRMIQNAHVNNPGYLPFRDRPESFKVKI